MWASFGRRPSPKSGAKNSSSWRVTDLLGPRSCFYGEATRRDTASARLGSDCCRHPNADPITFSDGDPIAFSYVDPSTISHRYRFVLSDDDPFAFSDTNTCRCGDRARRCPRDTWH